MPKRSRVRIALLGIEGTNCDHELERALRMLGARAELVLLKQFQGREVPLADRRRLSDYSALFVPGGWSGGDYVRAGAIFAARIRSAIGPELEEFVASGGLVGGVCNGFQVLTELGLLPGRPGGRLGPPEAALMPNSSGHFECRPTFLRWDGGNFAPLAGVPPGTRLYSPSAHGEGRLYLSGDEAQHLRRLEDAGQVLVRWVDPSGAIAGYPWNPNGSPGNVAGLTNPEGNVFGLMPHPERAFLARQGPDWTREKAPPEFGDGHRFLSAIIDHLARHG